MRWRIGFGWAATIVLLLLFALGGIEDGWDPRMPWGLGLVASVWILSGMAVGVSLARWIASVRRILVFGCWIPLTIFVSAWSIGVDREDPVTAFVPAAFFVLLASLGTEGLLLTGTLLRTPGTPRKRAAWTATAALAILAVTCSNAIAVPLETLYFPPPPPTRWSRTMQICIELRDRYPHWDRTDFTFPEWMARHKEEFRRVADGCPDGDPCSALLDVVSSALGEFENGHVRLEKPPVEDPSEAPQETSTNSPAPAVAAAPVRVAVRAGNAPVIRIVELYGDDFVRRLLEGLERPSAARGVVLDLRGCRGGNLKKMEHLVSHFLAAGAPTGRFAGPIEAGTRATVHEIELARADPVYASPLAVLVDPGTASAAEVAADLLCRRPRTRCFGFFTAGSTDLANAYPFEGGKLWVSKGTYESPDGEILQGQGVRPHELFFPFGSQFPEDGDKTLAAADAWLAAESSSPEVHSAP